MIEAIVFDFDGVLVDSEPLHYQAFLEVGRPEGFEFDYPAYIERYVGFDDRGVFEALLNEAGRREEAADPVFVAALIERKAQAFERVAAEQGAAMPGAEALVRSVGERWPLAIASGATQAEIRKLLDRIRLAGCFDPVVAADDVARSKPDPETYAQAVRRLGVPAAHCLAIEDTPAGLRAAREAGLRTLGVAGTVLPSELGEAERVADSLRGLDAETLERWFGEPGDG